jgi:hypothetical protein
MHADERLFVKRKVTSRKRKPGPVMVMGGLI